MPDENLTDQQAKDAASQDVSITKSVSQVIPAMGSCRFNLYKSDADGDWYCNVLGSGMNETIKIPDLETSGIDGEAILARFWLLAVEKITTPEPAPDPEP